MKALRRFGQRIILFALFGTLGLVAADFSTYRGIQLGAEQTVVAKQAGVETAEFRVIHKLPALIQEVDWEPPMPRQADSVKDGVLYFVNGELFRIAATYDRYKVEGLTTADMIEAISATYGVPTHPTAEVPYHSIYGETSPVEARWEDAQYSCNLVRTGDRKSFALVIYSKSLETAAQAAIAESARLDAMQAPQRELERLKHQDEEERRSLEKARAANKPNFRL